MTVRTVDHFSTFADDDLDAALMDATFAAPKAKPHVHSDERKPFADPEAARRFILGGKAKLTLKSLKTGTRFTYQVTAAESGDTYFVGLLCGADNENAYKYLGRISREVFWAGRKVPRPGDIGPNAPASRAFAWTWRHLLRHTIPAQLEIWHENTCGRCGRTLTVPESIASGFGPECINKIGM